MDKEQAINILEQALDIATKKGVYGIKDIEYILNALKAIKSE